MDGPVLYRGKTVMMPARDVDREPGALGRGLLQRTAATTGDNVAHALGLVDGQLTGEQLAEGKRKLNSFVVLKPTATGK